jgi:hypothetical protein
MRLAEMLEVRTQAITGGGFPGTASCIMLDVCIRRRPKSIEHRFGADEVECQRILDLPGEPQPPMSFA